MPAPHSHISWFAAVLATVIMATAGAVPVAAQARPKPKPKAKPRPQVEISANVGALAGASRFTESESFPVNAETETLTATHGTKAAFAFNAGGAVKIARRLWIGAQYAMADTKPDASISALVPHPLLFNAPRTVNGSISGVAHDERNVHLDLMYVLPVRALDVRAIGGPTFCHLTQDFISAMTVSETYPFDTATFASATTTRASKTAVGFNVGVDISHPLSRLVRVGALIRYSRTDVKFDQQTVKAGGVEAGGGVRIRF